MEERYLLKENKASTGIGPLDIILEGGYPTPSVISVIGPVGFEKALFGISFMSTKGRNYYFTTDMHPSEIIEKSDMYGIDLNKVKFIDIYSKPAGVSPRENDIIINSPAALNDMSLEISSILKEGKNTKLFFHSFSTMLLNNPLPSISKFLQVIAGRVKENDGILMLLFEDGLHKREELNIILKEVDYTMKIIKENNIWKIKSQLFPIDIKFDINNGGINIL